MRLWGLGSFSTTKGKKNHQAGQLGNRDHVRCKEGAGQACPVFQPQVESLRCL